MAAHGHSGASPGLLADADWLRAPQLQLVLDILEKDGGAARVVGGAVRNALLDEPINDIDIATPLLPADVMARASAAGLGVHPTGIDHGTVTLVAGGHAFEVTTLRRDVETDGRRAVVAFASNWREDAERRDFTINALYLTREGTVFDYFGGLEDIAHKRIRFIGSAQQRIREDYLRILRFFRFFAQYGHGMPDAEGLAACAELKAGIARLSAERIGAEMMKLLSAPRAPEAVSLMAETSVLEAVLGLGAHPERLAKLIAIESAHYFKPDALTRLAVLALDDALAASKLAARLRLSKSEAEALELAAHAHGAHDPGTPEHDARALLYALGPDTYVRAALFNWPASAADIGDSARAHRAKLPERWCAPPLPVRGADVLALGVPAGPRIGEVLKAFESWWISAGFPSDPAVHRAKLSALAGAS
jgi:poly(A) polymerase